MSSRNQGADYILYYIIANFKATGAKKCGTVNLKNPKNIREKNLRNPYITIQTIHDIQQEAKNENERFTDLLEKKKPSSN